MIDTTYTTASNVSHCTSQYSTTYIFFYFLRQQQGLFSRTERVPTRSLLWGEMPLKAMTFELHSDGLYKDDAVVYKTEGIITLYGMQNLEVLLLETSSHFGSSNSSKKAFDHHKGLYGALAMLKAFAGAFQYATVSQFGKLKFSSSAYYLLLLKL